MNDFSLPTKFDPLIHQSSRLSILAVLAGAASADFSYLLNATGLTKGTLSKHLTKLQNAEYVEIIKGFNGNYPHTLAKLTPIGRRAFNNYRRQLVAFSKLIEKE